MEDAGTCTPAVLAPTGHGEGAFEELSKAPFGHGAAVRGQPWLMAARTLRRDPRRAGAIEAMTPTTAAPIR